MNKKTVLKPKWMRLEEIIDDRSDKLEDLIPELREEFDNKDFGTVARVLERALALCTTILDAQKELADINS